MEKGAVNCADYLDMDDDLPFFFMNQKGSSEIISNQRWWFKYGDLDGDGPLEEPLYGYYIGIVYMQVNFNTDLSFVDFPFDKQTLAIRIRALWDEDVPIVLDSIDINSKNSPGWIVNSISSIETSRSGWCVCVS
jgi:hypothetical protein